MQKQVLQQRIQQKLSPQQLQLIKLLELSTIELEEKVKQELQDNPALEEGPELDAEADSDDDALGADDMQAGADADADLTLGDYLTEDDIPEYKLREIHERAEQREEASFALPTSLNEYLLQQLGLRDLDDKEMLIAVYVTGSLDDDGYLRRETGMLADDLIVMTGVNFSEFEIESVIRLIQDLDPTGICARSLQECLLLQLAKAKKTPAVKNAMLILREAFDEFSNKNYIRLMHKIEIDREDLRLAIEEITALDPRPGSSWSGGDGQITERFGITPDFVVETNNDELTIMMPGGDIPDIRVNREYLDMLHEYEKRKTGKGGEEDDATVFVKQKIDSAQSFVDLVKQRQQTLQQTMEAIVKFQRNFFLTGDESTIRRMVLKDISELSGFDISTVSRVSNRKYVQTNFGIYPLKYFFGDAIKSEAGEEVSIKLVKKILKDVIDAEDKSKPLTDEELTAHMMVNGFNIARRTIAKYREQLGIPVARLRKEI